MQWGYPLKKADKVNFTQPITNYLLKSESAQVSHNFHSIMSKITQLRNRVTILELTSDSSSLDKYINALEMYCRYALLMSKHMNWDPQYDPMVQNLSFIWCQSFAPQYKQKKSTINYEIFCCLYNLGILYFQKLGTLKNKNLIQSRKESIKSAKIAYYIFNQIRMKYEPLYSDCAFSDTNSTHIQILELVCLGIGYKNLFLLLKDSQYKIGINKIACIAGAAHKNFNKANQIAKNFFMRTSHITEKIKRKIYSLTYIESLYHDVLCNVKYAQHYENQMDENKENIKYVIAFQRKAFRLLKLGQNGSVNDLLKNFPQQKQQLKELKNQLQYKFEKTLNRNKQIYHQQQITQKDLPDLQELPNQYLIPLVVPENIKISYQDQIANSFIKLIDNQSKGFMLELLKFAQIKITELQYSFHKLNQNCQIVFQNNFVNFYLIYHIQQIKKTIPQVIKNKIQYIKGNGGKQKIQFQINNAKQSQQKLQLKVQQIMQAIHEEEVLDNKMRSKYGAAWKRLPSAKVNLQYYSFYQISLKSLQEAQRVNQNIGKQYNVLQKYIQIAELSQDQIGKLIPNIEIAQFMQQNKKEFDNLNLYYKEYKDYKVKISQIVKNVKEQFKKIDLAFVANKYFKEVQTIQQKQIINKIFQIPFQKINQYSTLAKCVQQTCQEMKNICLKLNNKNKNKISQNSQKKFKEICDNLNQSCSFIRCLNQSSTFYSDCLKILEKFYIKTYNFFQKRRKEAESLQKSLQKSNSNSYLNLPQMNPKDSQDKQRLPNPISDNAKKQISQLEKKCNNYLKFFKIK